MTVDERITPEFLKSLHMIDRLRLCYRVEFDHQEMNLVAPALDRSGRLQQVVHQINTLMPGADCHYKGSEPETPSKVHTYYVGRENSRVLYVQLCTNYFKPKPPEFWASLQKGLQAVGQRYQADENWLEEEDKVSFMWRYWWD